jgi:single-strand DNA-binding protein
MKSINEVRLLGNVTKDPEIRETANGHKVATFSIATNYVYMKGETKVEEPEFHNIVIWGKLAEVVEKYVKKGAPLHVSGRIKQRSWDKDDGTKAYRTEIICDDMIMVGGKKEGSSIPPITEDDLPEFAATPKRIQGTEEIDIQDIPF